MSNNIIVVTGLGFGDEGKGTITEYCAWRYGAKTVVRYNGGPQAAHNVVLKNSLHHCFAQFGSATFQPEATTFLSSQAVVNPISILSEAKLLQEKGVTEALKRLRASPSCLVATPFHKHHNCMLELSRGDARHGSCGMGVGQTIKDARYLGEMALRLGDLKNYEVAKRKLDFLWRLKIDQAGQLLDQDPGNKQLCQEFERLSADGYVEDVLEAYVLCAEQLDIAELPSTNGILLFEGAQGMLLDSVHGFHPHVAKTDVSPRAARRLAHQHWPKHRLTKLGVLRAYATRHGAGPFVTYDPSLTSLIPDSHNSTSEWQGAFRIGWFDCVASSYAIKAAGGVDCLAITNLDRISRFDEVKICIGYAYDGAESLDEYFDWTRVNNQKIIEQINVIQNPSIERQSAITKILIDCQPVYRTIKFMDSKAYIQRLESILDVPVALVSRGDTLHDKEEIFSLF